MSSTIIIKNSSEIGKVPLPADLQLGELAINLADKKLYSKDESGTVVDLSPGGAPVEQLQADWNQTDVQAADHILNKPTIPAAQVQARWTQNDTGAVDYIIGKPTIVPTNQVVTSVTLSDGYVRTHYGAFGTILPTIRSADVTPVGRSPNNRIKSNQDGLTAYPELPSNGNVNDHLVRTKGDLTSWSFVDTQLTSTITGLATDGARLVASGPNAQIAYSIDGLEWTVVTPTNLPTDTTYTRLMFDGQRFWAYGSSGYAAYSYDLTDWAGSPVTANALAIHTLLYSNKAYYASATDSGGAMKFLKSSSGTSWTVREDIIDPADTRMAGPDMVSCFGSFFFCSEQNLYWSDDGYIWISRRTADSGETFTAIAERGGIMVAVGTNGVVYSSQDGTIVSATPPAGSTGIDFTDVVAVDNGFILSSASAAPLEGVCWFSTDGAHWTRLPDTAQALSLVGYLGNKIVSPNGVGIVGVSSYGAGQVWAPFVGPMFDAYVRSTDGGSDISSRVLHRWIASRPAILAAHATTCYGRITPDTATPAPLTLSLNGASIGNITVDGGNLVFDALSMAVVGPGDVVTLTSADMSGVEDLVIGMSTIYR